LTPMEVTGIARAWWLPSHADTYIPRANHFSFARSLLPDIVF
jgi:hypothetical protein